MQEKNCPSRDSCCVLLHPLVYFPLTLSREALRAPDRCCAAKHIHTYTPASFREDLFESTPSSLGASFVGGMCHPRGSCSVVEAGTFKAVHVAAHELAHSMGVPHDGEVGAEACKGDGYLMSQGLTQASFSWSSCSKNAFTAFLQ